MNQGKAVHHKGHEGHKVKQSVAGRSGLFLRQMPSRREILLIFFVAFVSFVVQMRFSE